MKWLRVLILLGALLGGANTAGGQYVVQGQCGPQGCYVPRPSRPWGPPPARFRRAIPQSLTYPAIAVVYNGEYRGSGVLIANNRRRGLVLTAAHVVRRAVRGTLVVALGGCRYRAVIVGCDEGDDLALLRIAAPGEIRPMALSEEPPKKGEAVRTLGFGPSGQLLLTTGTAEGYMTADGQTGVYTLQTTGSTRSGCSGGPMLNANGQIVGVVFGTGAWAPGCYGTVCSRIGWRLRKWLPTWPPGKGRMQPPPAPPAPPLPDPPTPDPPEPVTPDPGPAPDPPGEALADTRVQILVQQQQQTTVVLTDVTKQLEILAGRLQALEDAPPPPDHSNQLAELSARIKALEDKPPPAQVDYQPQIDALQQDIAEAVARKMTFQMLDEQGNVIQEYQAGLGETVPFQLIPVKSGHRTSMDFRDDPTENP